MSSSYTIFIHKCATQLLVRDDWSGSIRAVPTIYQVTHCFDHTPDHFFTKIYAILYNKNIAHIRNNHIVHLHPSIKSVSTLDRLSRQHVFSIAVFVVIDSCFNAM